MHATINSAKQKYV